jgi:hypothetical protein
MALGLKGARHAAVEEMSAGIARDLERGPGYPYY